MLLQSILEAHNIDFFMYGPKKGEDDNTDEAMIGDIEDEEGTDNADALSEIENEQSNEEVATEEIVDKTDNKRKEKIFV